MSYDTERPNQIADGAPRALPAKIVTSLHSRFVSLTVGCLLLLVAVFAAYYPALQGGFLWDDYLWVTQNPVLTDAHALRRIWLQPTDPSHPQYYPLTHTVFLIEHRLWGEDPFGYHVVNVALHGLNGILVWLIMRRLRFRGGWLAACIFALHPVLVQSVAWVTELKNVLSGLFALASTLVFLISDEARSVRKWTFYVLSIILFVLALLSKTSVACLPAALLLVLWARDGNLCRRSLAALAPLFALGLVLGAATAAIERHTIGAQGPDWEFTFAQRLLMSGRAFWFYLGKLAWPAGLCFSYPKWPLETGKIAGYLWPLSAAALPGLLWFFRARIGRWPLTAVLVYCAMIAPALGFFHVYAHLFYYVADHWVYLASIGPIALVAVAIATPPGRYAASGQTRPRLGVLMTALATVVVFSLGTATFVRTHVYRDAVTLWRDTASRNPSSWLASLSLAMELIDRGKSREAIKYFEQGLKNRPNVLEAHYNVGVAYRIQGNWEQALRHFREAIRIDPARPGPRMRAGEALENLGRLSEAISMYREELQLVPGNAAAAAALKRASAAGSRPPTVPETSSTLGVRQ